jgi:integrase
MVKSTRRAYRSSTSRGKNRRTQGSTAPREGEVLLSCPSQDGRQTFLKAGEKQSPSLSELRRLAAQSGVRRRFAPHQLPHAHALELAREGVPLNIIQRQLGHTNLGTASIYLQGIDPEEIIAAVRARRAPMMSASAGLQL